MTLSHAVISFFLVAVGGFLTGTAYGKTISQEALDELAVLRAYVKRATEKL